MGLNFCPKASALILVTGYKRNIRAFKKFSESLVYVSVVCFLSPGLLSISNLKHKQEILCNCNRGCIVLQQGDSTYATFQSLLWKGEESLKRTNNNKKNHFSSTVKLCSLKRQFSNTELVSQPGQTEIFTWEIGGLFTAETPLRPFTTQLQHFTV